MSIFTKIGAFLVKEEIAIANDAKQVEKTIAAIGAWLSKAETKVEAIIKAAEADLAVLEAAVSSPAVQAAIAAIKDLIVLLGADL